MTRQRLVLVHGSAVNGEVTWGPQRGLRFTYELLILNRPGYPPNPLEERIDFEEQGHWVAEQLRPGDHLLGNSYGGLICLYAAAAQPELRSLAVIEPPAFGLARGHPAVDEVVDDYMRIWERRAELDPREYLVRFLDLVGSTLPLPAELPPVLEASARASMAERPPQEADPPLDELARASFPKLVLSGGHSEAFDAVCDVLAERIGAERVVLPGAGHSVAVAPGFNDTLKAFLANA